MKQWIADGLSFFRDDFFPNLGYYLLQIFLIVLVVLIFSGINILVRFITDPICIKVLRMREDKRWPGMVGLFLSTIVTAILLVFIYNSFPQVRSTVIGWTGEKLQQLITWDRLPDLDIPTDEAVPVPEKSPPPALKKVGSPADIPAPGKTAPPPAAAPPPGK
jgi:hypothetical protein